MSGRAWAIKLGSGGRCVAFCEQHRIVGVGWPGVDLKVVTHGSRHALWEHIRDVYRRQVAPG
jgi:hypothetical protein